MALERKAPVALVTGSSRGIGNHLAKHFLGQGYAVVGCSRREYAECDSPRYRHYSVDVGVEADVVDMFQAIRREYGRLDVAINNAACNETLSLVSLTAASDAGRTLATNVLGPFIVCREAVRLMMRRGFGRIVNLGSIATRYEVRGEAVYTASKAAVGAMTRVLAKEVAAYGITCNIVSPTAVETELMSAVAKDKLAEVLAQNAITSIGDAADVAAVIDWLVSPSAGSVTGQSVYLGGA